MITKSGKEYLNSRFDRIEQIQDFSTIQTTFLAIVFSLFVLSLTAIFTNYDTILTAISYIMIAFETILLYFLLLSIFPGNLELKLLNFNTAIFLTIFIFIYLGVAYAVITIRYWITEAYEAGNVDIVIILLLTCIIVFPLNYWVINPRYKERFNELFINSKPSKSHKILEILNILLEKGIKKFGVYFIISIFFVIFTGLVRTPSGYGFPFYWFFKGNSGVWEVNYQYLYLNIIIFTIIIATIIYIYKFFSKEKSDVKIKNQINWENDKNFVRIQK